MLNTDSKSPLTRVVAGLAGLVVLGWGFRGISWQQALHFQNWFGELAFAPFAILAGLVILLGALFKPQILGAAPKKSRH
jgi:hypothetical protein